MITIREIAQIAKVSPSTVSKALNNRHDVSLETKNKIFDIVSKYNYNPRLNNRKKKTNTLVESIGIIICRDQYPLSGNPFYSRVLEGIEAELEINNYSLVLYLLPNHDTSKLPKMVKEKQVDGIILVGVINQNFIKQIITSHLPTVLVDPQVSTQYLSQVLIDNEYGAFQATTHLIQNGHKKIGFISGDLTRLSFNQRLIGYQKALAYNNIEFNEHYVCTSKHERGYDHVCQLLSLKDKPTAIFAANDINAIHGYMAARELAFRIPEDISFIGFDDIDITKSCDPPLSTIRVYKEELGSIATREILKIMSHPEQNPTTVVVPTQLIERKSVKNITNRAENQIS